VRFTAFLYWNYQVEKCRIGWHRKIWDKTSRRTNLNKTPSRNAQCNATKQDAVELTF